MSDDEQAIREAAEKFKAALNAMLAGDASAMAEVWSHADDVTYMGPAGGIRVGRRSASRSWAAPSPAPTRCRARRTRRWPKW